MPMPLIVPNRPSWVALAPLPWAPMAYMSDGLVDGPAPGRQELCVELRVAWQSAWCSAGLGAPTPNELYLDPNLMKDDGVCLARFGGSNSLFYILFGSRQGAKDSYVKGLGAQEPCYTGLGLFSAFGVVEVPVGS